MGSRPAPILFGQQYKPVETQQSCAGRPAGPEVVTGKFKTWPLDVRECVDQPVCGKMVVYTPSTSNTHLSRFSTSGLLMIHVEQLGPVLICDLWQGGFTFEPKQSVSATVCCLAGLNDL